MDNSNYCQLRGETTEVYWRYICKYIRRYKWRFIYRVWLYLNSIIYRMLLGLLWINLASHCRLKSREGGEGKEQLVGGLTEALLSGNARHAISMPYNELWSLHKTRCCITMWANATCFVSWAESMLRLVSATFRRVFRGPLPRKRQ